MKTDIILSGVGGQGILSIATIIGHAALTNGLYIKQAEVHGMSQRGGDVQSPHRIRPHTVGRRRCHHLYGTDGSPKISALPLKKRMDHHIIDAFHQHSELS